MAKPNKIRQANQEATVRKLAAKGLGFREIAAELKSRGVNVSHMAVSRFIQEETQDRRDAAQSVAASQAKDSVPLVQKALTGIIKQGMNIMVLKYRGKGNDEKPQPEVLLWSSAAKVTAGAARALHAVTMGEGPGVDALSQLRQEAQRLLADKRKRDREDPEDESEEGEEAQVH